MLIIIILNYYNSVEIINTVKYYNKEYVYIFIDWYSKLYKINSKYIKEFLEDYEYVNNTENIETTLEKMSPTKIIIYCSNNYDYYYNKIKKILKWNIVLVKKNYNINDIELDIPIYDNGIDAINKTYSNKKKDVIEYLITIYKHSEPFISDRLKNIIKRRAENNIKTIKYLFDNYNFLDEQEYHKFINKEKDNNIIKSEDLFTSFFTLSSWYDELESHGCIGVLADCKTGYRGKIGNSEFLNFNPSWDLLSGDEYLYLVKRHLINNESTNINEAVITLDKYKNKVNAIFILYINKLHWNSAKKFISFLTATFMSHNPFAFTEGHLKSYYIALCRYSHDLNNNKNVNIFLNIWRSCYELAKEKKYITKFNNSIDIFLNKINKFRYFGQYEIGLGQSLLIKELNIEKYYDLCLNEIIKDYFIKIKNKKEKMLLSKLKYDYIMKNRVNNLKEHSWHYNNLIHNIKIRNGLFTVFKNEKEIIQKLDNNYGIIEDKLLYKFVNILNSDINIYDNNYLDNKINIILNENNII